MIQSESSFRHDAFHDKAKRVKGMAAINTRYFDAGSDVKENIRAGAVQLRTNLDKHNGNYLQAIWSYKGRGLNKIGLKQAQQVLLIYGRIK